MKKKFLLLLLLSVVGTSSLLADSNQSFKIDDQTGVFSVRFTAVPNAANINGAVGLGGKQVAAWGDFNCILRFGENNIIDVYNGAGTPGYTADVELTYIPNRRYYVQMDIDVPNSRYSVKVTPPDGNTVVLASDYTFRSNELTGAINYLSTRIVNTAASIGLLDFQVGEETIETNHYNFNTDLEPLTGDFAVKFVATPSHDNINGAIGISSMKVAAWNQFNGIIQFNSDGTLKAWNGTDAYQAVNAIPYSGGERYLLIITGNTTSKTYNVKVVSPDGSITVLAEDYTFRLNGPADGEAIAFIGQRVVHSEADNGVPGSYIAVDGIETGSFGMDGVNPAFIQAIEPQTDIFTREFVVIPNMDKVDAAVTFNETDGVAWGGMNAMISFNTAGLIKVRNGTSYSSEVDVPYRALGAYQFKVDFDVVKDIYSVSVRTNPNEAPIVVATDYAFRNSAAEIKYMTNKSTWDETWGVPGGYLTVSQAALPVSIKVGNNAPTINPIEDVNFYMADNTATIDLSGISDGDGGNQTLTLTAVSSDESITTVEIIEFTSGESTAKLKISAVAVGQTTVTLTAKDDGGTENGGVDETSVSFDVEVLEWSSVRDLSIRANEGEWGAVNRVLTGQQNDGEHYEAWLTTNTGGAKMVNDNIIINRSDRFVYAMYIRFDLGSLPETGAASNVKFQIFTEAKDYDRDSLVLFVLEDQYFPVKDYQGFDDTELDELYIEGDEGAWIKVYDGTSGDFIPGYEYWITSDNAPGFNEGNLVDLGPDWHVYNEDILFRIGDMHTISAGDSIVTIEHEDIATYINEDGNGVIVFVLGKLPQNSWAQRVEVYSNHDLGKEPRISFTWDDDAGTNYSPVITGKSVVNIYPNPVNDFLNYSGADEMSQALIYNSQGKLVLNSPVNSTAGVINVSGFKAGFYFIEFRNQSNTKNSRSKVVIF